MYFSGARVSCCVFSSLQASLGIPSNKEYCSAQQSALRSHVARLY